MTGPAGPQGSGGSGLTSVVFNLNITTAGMTLKANQNVTITSGGGSDLITVKHDAGKKLVHATVQRGSTAPAAEIGSVFSLMRSASISTSPGIKVINNNTCVIKLVSSTLSNMTASGEDIEISLYFI
jgi:hypothetical protein